MLQEIRAKSKVRSGQVRSNREADKTGRGERREAGRESRCRTPASRIVANPTQREKAWHGMPLLIPRDLSPCIRPKLNPTLPHLRPRTFPPHINIHLCPESRTEKPLRVTSGTFVAHKSLSKTDASASVLKNISQGQLPQPPPFPLLLHFPLLPSLPISSGQYVQGTT